MGSKIVFVDKDNCTACSQCVDDMPKYFEVDDEGYSQSRAEGSEINRAVVADEDIAAVEKMIGECPGESIHWMK